LLTPFLKNKVPTKKLVRTN